MTREEAIKQASNLTEIALANLRAAEKLAEEFEFSFCFSPAYGMGGSYVPTKLATGSWYDEAGWQASSHNC